MKPVYKKYQVIYKGGQVVDYKEIPNNGGEVVARQSAVSDKRPQGNPIDRASAPIKRPQPPKPAGPDRTLQVINECIRLGIKRRDEIKFMLEQRYAGSKSANYIDKSLARALRMLDL